MRRKILLSVLCAIGAVSACKSPDTTITTARIPTGGVRFINAVPDTAGAFGMDFRFIDLVESNAQFRVTFRNNISTATPFVSTLTEFKGAQAGSRHFRIFFDDTIQTIASTVLKDSSITVADSANYTVMLWGPARTAGMNMVIWPENVGDPGANVALRAVNATGSAVDVRVYLQGSAVPVAVTWTIPAYARSPYINVAPGNYMYNVQPAGGGATLFADAQAIQGVLGQIDLEALPGTLVAGSAVSGFIYPRSTAGARTPPDGSVCGAGNLVQLGSSSAPHLRTLLARA